MLQNAEHTHQSHSTGQKISAFNRTSQQFTNIHHVHSAMRLMTGPPPLPMRVLHRVRSSASSFNFQYPLFSVRSSSSCLHLSRLPVTVLPSIFPSITCSRRQFLSNMWPMQLVFLPSFYCMQDIPLALRNSKKNLTSYEIKSARRRTFYLYNAQHSQQTYLCAPGGTRARNPSTRAPYVDPRLRPRSYRDWSSRRKTYYSDWSYKNNKHIIVVYKYFRYAASYFFF